MNASSRMPVWLEKRHLRFSGMRSGARRHGKYVPTIKELNVLVPSDMKCVVCKRRMVWFARHDRTRVMTLQHDRNGRLRMICKSCNTRHYYYPGDSFYSVPRDQKRCFRCEAIKPLGAFPHQHHERWKNRSGMCRVCAVDAWREWRNRNRDHRNAYLRRRRQERREGTRT